MNDWTRPSQCESAACAEVKKVGGSIFIRSSERQHQLAWFSPEEWKNLIEAAKRGEYDL